MKGKILAVALVVMMVAGALVLASCSSCPGDGDCKVDVTDMLGSLASWCFTGDFDAPDFDQKVKDCFGVGDDYDLDAKLTCEC